jgi:hypothetical protein
MPTPFEVLGIPTNSYIDEIEDRFVLSLLIHNQHQSERF